VKKISISHFGTRKSEEEKKNYPEIFFLRKIFIQNFERKIFFSKNIFKGKNKNNFS